MKAKQWVLKKQFEGNPKSTDVGIKEVSLPKLKDGEVMIECLAISVDPYQRIFVKNAKPGDVMYGEQVAKVIESKNADYPVGTHVTTFAGWTTHAVLPGDKLVKVPEYPPDVPIGLALGLLGMTGKKIGEALGPCITTLFIIPIPSPTPLRTDPQPLNISVPKFYSAIQVSDGRRDRARSTEQRRFMVSYSY